MASIVNSVFQNIFLSFNDIFDKTYKPVNQALCNEKTEHIFFVYQMIGYLKSMVKHRVMDQNLEGLKWTQMSYFIYYDRQKNHKNWKVNKSLFFLEFT